MDPLMDLTDEELDETNREAALDPEVMEEIEREELELLADVDLDR